MPARSRIIISRRPMKTAAFARPKMVSSVLVGRWPDWLYCPYAREVHVEAIAKKGEPQHPT